jgi:hypothetical protein
VTSVLIKNYSELCFGKNVTSVLIKNYSELCFGELLFTTSLPIVYYAYIL